MSWTLSALAPTGNTVAGTGTTALYVAIAGGLGVFLGTVVSQVLQTWRDRERQKFESQQNTLDRQAAEEKERREYKREAYVKLAALTAEYETKLLEYRDAALSQVLDFAKYRKPPTSPSRATETHVEIERTLADAFALARTYGSTPLITSITFLRDNVPNLGFRARDELFNFHCTLLTRMHGGTAWPRRMIFLNRRDNVPVNAFRKYFREGVEILQQANAFAIACIRFELNVDPQNRGQHHFSFETINEPPLTADT